MRQSDTTTSLQLELSVAGRRKEKDYTVHDYTVHDAEPRGRSKDMANAPTSISAPGSAAPEIESFLKQLQFKYQEMKKADIHLHHQRQQWLHSIEKWILQQQQLTKQMHEQSSHLPREAHVHSVAEPFNRFGSQQDPASANGYSSARDAEEDLCIAEEESAGRSLMRNDQKVGSQGATGGGGVWSGGKAQEREGKCCKPDGDRPAEDLNATLMQGRASSDSMKMETIESMDIDDAESNGDPGEKQASPDKELDENSDDAPGFRISWVAIRNWYKTDADEFDAALSGKKAEKGAKKKRFRRAITTDEELQLDEKIWWLRRVVMSSQFDAFIAMLIIFNALMIGAEVEYIARSPEGQTLRFFVAAQYGFSLIFLIELGLRLIVFKLSFFTSSNDWAWNMFDLGLVMLSLIEMVITICAPEVLKESFVNVSAQRVIRVLRVVRNVRMVRVMRFFREFRMMVYAILGSVKTLLWLMILLFLMLYFFALCFTQGTTDFLLEKKETVAIGVVNSQAELLEESYSTLPRSMFSLFKAMTSGVNWGVIVAPLSELHWIYVGLFVIFISFAIFCVLNAVTGVFVDSAMQTTQYEQDLAIQNEMRNREKHVNQLRLLFEEMDYDKSGTITFEEFDTCLQDPRMRACLEALGIDTSELGALFTLLDIDNNGDVEICEFVSGCMRLKGEAKSVDIAVLMYENKRMVHRWSLFMQYVQEQFEQILKQDKKPGAPGTRESRITESMLLLSGLEPQDTAAADGMSKTEFSTEKQHDGCESATNVAVEAEVDADDFGSCEAVATWMAMELAEERRHFQGDPAQLSLNDVQLENHEDQNSVGI